MYKKGLLFFLLSIFPLFVVSRVDAITQDLTHSQAKNYIENVLSSLFSPKDHAGSYEQDFKVYVNEVTNIILKNQGYYSSFWSLNKSYKASEIYESLLNDLVNFVERHAKRFANDSIKSFFIHENVDKNKVVSSAIKALRNEVIKFITNSANLDAGCLANYMGAPLKARMHELVKEELKKVPGPSFVNPSPKPQPKPPVYISKECPVCYGDFNDTLKRMMLSCGHNLCADCLKEWYHEKGEKVSCPICRIKISNIKELIKEIEKAEKPQVYTTQECPICLEDFSISIKRIYLKCGHNICGSCLVDWSNTKKENAACPMCNVAINLKDYSKELAKIK